MTRHTWLLALALASCDRKAAEPGPAPSASAASAPHACDREHPRECGALADRYVTGRGVPRDIPRGLRLYEDACKRGDGLSCQSLGATHSGDRPQTHIRPDFAKAIEWYDRGCKLDHTPCCTRLGELLSDGVVVKPDPVRANAAFQKACDGDAAYACERLANHHHRGVGTKRDEERAEKLMKKACRLGNITACRIGLR